MNEKDEPEVTPEMITAGVAVISDALGRKIAAYFDAPVLAAKVYRAMWAQRPREESK